MNIRTPTGDVRLLDDAELDTISGGKTTAEWVAEANYWIAQTVSIAHMATMRHIPAGRGECAGNHHHQ
jgi:hypothetical protein